MGFGPTPWAVSAKYPAQIIDKYGEKVCRVEWFGDDAETHENAQYVVDLVNGAEHFRATLAERDAEIARLRAEREWRPIEAADRTSSKPVDIWLVPPGKTVSEGHRVPNCRPALQNAWVDDRSIGGQFVTGRYFYDDDGDRCLDPDDISEQATRATHWGPIPAPPEAA